MKKERKTKKWWQYLLQIPIALIVYALLLAIAVIVDSKFGSGSGAGHPMPAVTVVAALVLAVVTVIVIIRAIVLAVKSGRQWKKQTGNPGPVKPVWKCFIPLFVQLPVSVVLVLICGKYEVDSFYNDPDHIGFPVPVTTFLLAGLLATLLVITLVATLVAAAKRSRSNVRAGADGQPASEMKNGGRFCEYCGSLLPDGAEFCPACGAGRAGGGS